MSRLVLYTALEEFKLRTGWSNTTIDVLSFAAAPLFFPAMVIHGAVMDRREARKRHSRIG